MRPLLENAQVVAGGRCGAPLQRCGNETGRIIRYSMPQKLLACMQVLEYDRSFLASRILFDKFNGNIIISGAFGLFQKELVIQTGGYDPSHHGGGYGAGC